MSSGNAVPQPFQPPNQAGAAAGLSSAANNLGSLGNTTTGAAVPGYQAIYNAVQNNPYYSGAQTAANQVGAAGQAFGQQEQGWATGLGNIAGSLGQYSTGIAQTAFDPQNQLYNQQQQANTDQTNAMNAQSGVAGSPFGAGLSAQSNQNFNLGWQNNQQQRQIAGVGALGSLANTQSGLYGAAGDLGTSGLNTQYESGQLPSTTYQGNQTAIEDSLNALVTGDVNAGSPYSSQASADTAYLGIGQTASQNALAAEKQQYAQDNAFWSGIGQLAGDAGNIAGAFIGI